jgi:hypothetical protein
MSITTTSPDRSPRREPRLRLVHGIGAPHPDEEQREDSHASGQASQHARPGNVLVAGADAETRSSMLGELRNLLPANTRFLEACETWEVLARAASSRMVVLTDDFEDISTKSLVRLLGRRHPTLPVLAVGRRVDAGPPTNANAASA